VSAVADTTHFKVGTLDVNSFLGSTAALTTGLAKATLAVTNVFGSPDIFAMQEADNQATLQQLATTVNTANGNSTTYTATVLGTETTNSGFLVNTSTVKNANYIEIGRGTTYTASNGSQTLWDHPPLVLQGEFARVGKNYPVTVINVHMTPRDNSGDPTLGADIRTRRATQAAAISTLVQQYQTAGANVIVAGNFNAYEYNDGYVDVVGIIDGSPAAATAVTLYQASSTTAALTDFTTSVTANTRYNIIERGNAAALEHILASATVTDSTTAATSLASYVNTVTQPHFSTDHAAIDANDPTTPAGLTPHDGFLVNFAIPPVPTTASIAPTALNFGDVYIGDSKTLTATVTNTTTFSSTVNVTNIAISGTNAADYTQSSTCTSLAMGSTCTVSVTFAPTATGTRTATLTVSTDTTSNPTLTVSLTGAGLDTTATLSPTSADFGIQILNTTSAAKVFTWTNTSSVALAISSVDATGDYSVSGTTCTGKIAANTSCAINVVFTPIALRTRTGTLTVTSASSLDGTLTASLTGIGVADVEASADSLSFGTVDVGSSSAWQTLTITNYTNAAIALTGMTVSGDYSATVNTCPATLAGKASCTVSLVFTPTAIGVRTGSLVIITNDTKFPVITVALTGNGVDFSVSVAPTSGSVIAGLSVSPVATITPFGGFNGTITMSCTTIATGAACAYATNSFALTAATTDALTITTTSKYTVIGYGGLLFAPGHRGLLATLMALCAAALLFAGRQRASLIFTKQRHAIRLLLAFAALSLMAGAMSGCGNKNPALNSSYTSPGTYNILITATDGTITHTAAYSLTVTAK
jgi:endonuclease/exonuclease/phosphatase family metal-dependent hydrolase